MMSGTVWFLPSLSAQEEGIKALDAREVLQKSIAWHDPEGNWDKVQMKLHIQEPRLNNPDRRSIIMLDNATGAFRLERNRKDHITTHIITDDGVAVTLLDDAEIKDPLVIKEYRLEPNRNGLYRKFYSSLVGLPMSLTDEKIVQYGGVTNEFFNETNSLKVPLVLNDGVFSNHWNLYIAQDDYRLSGVEMYFPDDAAKGERLYFDQIIIVEAMRLPRMRHWHGISDDSYSGSDIIVKQIE